MVGGKLTANWFSEAAGGFGNTIEITKELYHQRSAYQDIAVYETRRLGRMLTLDGVVQLTEFDEFAYHEMMAHVPFYAYASGVPRRALVIGGGDGGVLRELSRHPELERLDICEIDAEVIAAARRFLPFTACGFDDPRVKIHIADGSCFVAENRGCYDLIIVDSTDPGGPGEPLFGAEFYAGLKQALRPGGVIASQGESAYLWPDIVRRLNRLTGELFQYSGYASILVPTYPSGLIGTCVASDGGDVALPHRAVPSELQKRLRYYNFEVHRSGFVQPQFVVDLLRENL